MQVTEVASEGLKRAYSVVVPASEIAATRDRRLAALAKDLRLPGFRPGKVPASVVQKRYGQAVLGEVLEQSVNDATRQVVTDRGLRTAQQPKIEVVNFADGADLEFKVDLEVMPEIPMPDFSAVRLERLKAVPGDEALNKALETLAERNRTLEDVAPGRYAEPGEVVVADFVGRIDGEAFEGGSAQDVNIEVGGPGFIPGFTDQIAGMYIGDTRTITATFPEDYGAKELAGKTAEFELTVKAIKYKVLPAIDDALAQKLGFEDLEKIKDLLREQMQREYDQLSRMKVKRALLDQLADQAGFPVPEGLVQAEFDQIWQRVEADRKAGNLDEDDQGKDEETLKAEYRGIAERRIRLGLLLSEIGRTNNIQVGSEEMARAMRQEASRYPGQEQAVLDFFRKNPQAADGLRAPLFEEKVVDFMLELAQVTDREVTPEELAAPPADAARA
ncbi:trigger factor [Roseomonas sp. NAR14]|uniref:Trigger factor n=1 Tax=Roseomonas acroporae TaxID=2937791 RepID=A0A9X1Y2M0_9PROT|nr:trigger factor [Roseomonas acroporae]MCK8782799.1 trigger factor [Roseomonas acroporae]